MIKVVVNWEMYCFELQNLCEESHERRKILKVVEMTITFSLLRKYKHCILSQIQVLLPFDYIGSFSVNLIIDGCMYLLLGEWKHPKDHC